MHPGLKVVDLGRMSYRDALEAQRRHLDEVLAAREAKRPEIGRLLTVEHDPPVITVTGRATAAGHVLATPADLRALGVTIEPTDRGGDVTYHGPGQVVIYPIIDLEHLRLRLTTYLRLLEAAAMDACATFGVRARRDPAATGVWVPKSRGGSGADAKICAIGIRVKRWIALHGMALNVAPDMSHFGLIVPCGLQGRPVTSLKLELSDRCPTFEQARDELARRVAAHLGALASGGIWRDGGAPRDDLDLHADGVIEEPD